MALNIGADLALECTGFSPIKPSQEHGADHPKLSRLRLATPTIDDR